MGLDANTFATPTHKTHDGADIEPVELWYGRKENEIQGFFERNYNHENCDDTLITQELLDKLREELESGQLVKTTGFFYGMGASDEAYLRGAVENFISIAEKALADDSLTDVRYWCWY